MRKLLAVSFFLMVLPIQVFAQTNTNSLHDTLKLQIQNDLAWEFLYTDPDTCILIAKQTIDLIHRFQFKKNTSKAKLSIKNAEADAYGMIGTAYFIKSDFSQALKNNFMSVRIYIALKNEQRLASRYGNIGGIYNSQGHYAQAMEYYLKALRLSEKLKDKVGIARHSGNIGNIYESQGETDKALNCFLKGIKMALEINDKSILTAFYGNAGNVYYRQNKLENATNYYFKALHIAQEIGDKSNMAAWLGNIGLCFSDRGNYDSAMVYELRALNTAREIGSKELEAINLLNIGSLYLSKGKTTEARKLIMQSLKIGEEINYLQNMKECNRGLFELYEKQEKHELALFHYKKYIEANDSIANDEATKKQTRLEMQYDFDKQQTADSLKTASLANSEKLKHEQEIKQQKIYTYGGIAGFALMLIVAVVSFRAFRNKQKANYIIAQQKHLVEEKQIEILASIQYAKRIQQALLPSTKYIQRTIHKLSRKN